MIDPDALVPCATHRPRSKPSTSRRSRPPSRRARTSSRSSWARSRATSERAPPRVGGLVDREPTTRDEGRKHGGRDGAPKYRMHRERALCGISYSVPLPPSCPMLSNVHSAKRLLRPDAGLASRGRARPLGERERSSGRPTQARWPCRASVVARSRAQASRQAPGTQQGKPRLVPRRPRDHRSPARPLARDLDVVKSPVS